MNTKEYNRQYAITHPELREKARKRAQIQRLEAKAFRQSQDQELKSKKGARPTQVVHDSKTALYLELALVPCLLACLTYLLLTEMVSFYTSFGGSPVTAWVRAIGIETTALFFSFLGHSSAFRTWVYKAMALAVCLFSIYTMTAKTFSDGVSLARADSITERSVSDLETAIQEKRSQRDDLQTHGWITAARKTDRAIDAMRIELSHLRAKLTEAHPSSATASTTLAQIIFRVLLMLGNILLADRLRLCLASLETLRCNLGVSRNDLGIPRKKQKVSRRKDPPQKSQSRGVVGKDWFWKWFPTGERVKV